MATAIILLLAAAQVAECRITIEFGSSARRAARKQQALERRRSQEEDDDSGEWATAARQAAAVDPPPPPFVTRGWLWKKGHIRHNWKRRWFVLSEDWSDLRYYDRASADGTPTGEALGCVVLGGAVATCGLDYVPKRAHVFAFTLRTNSEVYYCEAATEEERQRWVRTLNTAGAARRRGLVEDEVAFLIRSDNATRPSPNTFGSTNAQLKGLPTLFESSSLDAIVDDVVAFHKERAVARVNRLLNAESTLTKINTALRGAYLVESIDLSLLEPVAGVAVRAAKLEPSPPAVVHRLLSGPDSRCVRLVVEFDWPQRLECRVSGARPAGGGLPSFLMRALSRNMLGRHEISFSLASRLARRSSLALDLVSSKHAPWPVLRHVGVERLPLFELDRDALDVDDDRGFVGVVFSFVPKEVIAGLLENAINDALHRTGAPKLSWDLSFQKSRDDEEEEEEGEDGTTRKRRRRPFPSRSDDDEDLPVSLKRRPLYTGEDKDHRYLSWLPSSARSIQSVTTVEALRSVASMAASAARTAARDSALAAAKVQAAAESLRAAVLDNPDADPPLSALAIYDDDDDDVDLDDEE